MQVILIHPLGSQVAAEVIAGDPRSEAKLREYQAKGYVPARIPSDHVTRYVRAGGKRKGYCPKYDD